MTAKSQVSLDSADIFYAAEFINYGKYLASFPKDDLIQIFIRCLEPGDIFNISRVHRHWGHVCLDSLVWSSLLKRHFSHSQVDPKSDCRALYKKQVHLESIHRIELSIWHGRYGVWSVSDNSWYWPWQQQSSYIHVTNNLLVTGCKNAISLFDPVTKQKFSCFKTQSALSAIISKDNYLCAATQDLSIHVWDVIKRCALPVSWVSDEPISTLLITDNHFLCAHSITGTIHVWNLEKRNQPPTVYDLGASCFASRDHCLYIGEPSGTVTAWEVATQTLLYEVAAGVTSKSCLKATKNFLVIGLEDGSIDVIDRLTGESRYVFFLSYPKQGMEGLFVPNLCVQGDTTLYVPLGCGIVGIFDLMTGKRIAILKCYDIHNPSTHAKIDNTKKPFRYIDVQGDIVIAGSEEEQGVIVWDTKRKLELRSLPTGGSPVTYLKLHNNRIYVRVLSGKVYIWELRLPLVREIRDSNPLYFSGEN
jgi:hypothetical protein